MNNIFDLLNNFGIVVDESTPTIVLLAGYYLIISVFVLLNVFNICFYLVSIYIVSNEKFLNKIPSKYAYVHKFLIFYKNIRVIYIIFEAILLIFLISLMIWVSYGFVSHYLAIK